MKFVSVKEGFDLTTAVGKLLFDILAGFAGRTSLGHGAIFGVSGYVVVYASAQAGLPPALEFGPLRKGTWPAPSTPR